MASKVMHGRRKGQQKDLTLPDIEQGSRSAPVGMRLPDGTDLRQVTVLSKGDWERIQQQLNKRAIEEERIRRAVEEKQRLHELSKEQIKNWHNTIEGQRQKKLEARQIREEKEEEERRVIDIEEAKFQAQKRKEAIERAKTQQYYQTDRVKKFHGALLLTEVLKEREAQLELKSLKEKALQGQDKIWIDKEMNDYEEGILRDQEEARKRIQKTRKTAGFQKAQIEGHVRAHQKEVHEDRLEGEELKRLAAQYQLEKKKLEEIRKQEATGMMVDNVRQIEDVHKMRAIQKQQAEEEDEECRIFAAAKRKMMKLRAEKEKQLHQEKQQRLEQIREKLNAQMQQKMDDEDDRIVRAVEENEAKRAAEEAEKETGNRKMQKEMSEHRVQQLKEQERKLAEERRKELETLAVRREADIEFAKNEEEKRRRKLMETKSLQTFHLKQKAEVESNQVVVRQELLAQDEKNLELVRLEETQFQEYANKVINHCEKGGRNVYPLRKAALGGAGGGQGPVFEGKGGVRPSYMVCDQSGVQMPHYQRGTTDDVKEKIYGKGHTNKRLGFVW